MYLNKNEAEWVRLIAVERLNKIANQIKEIEDEEDRKWLVDKTEKEIEALEKVIEKIN